MKIKMTIDECLEFSDEWSKGLTLHEDSTGWRVVCMLLAEEVRSHRHNAEESMQLARLDERVQAGTEIQIACGNGELPDVCESVADFIVRSNK